MKATRSCLLALLLTFSFVSPTSVNAQDPWARAALPTACYGEQDNYAEAMEQAKTDLETEGTRRDGVNKALRDQIFGLDPAALQQRLMAAVQKNPAQAQEIMAAIQQQGTQENTGATMTASHEHIQFEQKKEALGSAYKAERDATLNPIVARIRQHDKGKGTTAEDQRIMREGWAEYNSKYETVLCAKWWKQKAPALMAEFRTFQKDQQIPKAATVEASSKRLLDLFGFSSATYQPTAEISGVIAYLRFAIDLFRDREGAPGGAK